MYKKYLLGITMVIITLSLLISSCNSPDYQDVYKITEVVSNRSYFYKKAINNNDTLTITAWWEWEGGYIGSYKYHEGTLVISPPYKVSKVRIATPQSDN